MDRRAEDFPVRGTDVEKRYSGQIRGFGSLVGINEELDDFAGVGDGEVFLLTDQVGAAIVREFYLGQIALRGEKR